VLARGGICWHAREIRLARRAHSYQETRAMAEDARAKAGGERYYEETGEHGRAGYYVKTVGNAPVVAPTALTAEEAAAKAAPKRSGSGSAWCDRCPSVQLGRDLCTQYFLCVVVNSGTPQAHGRTRICQNGPRYNCASVLSSAQSTSDQSDRFRLVGVRRPPFHRCWKG
jgi:hypothetical protein